MVILWSNKPGANHVPTIPYQSVGLVYPVNRLSGRGKSEESTLGSLRSLIGFRAFPHPRLTC